MNDLPVKKQLLSLKRLKNSQESRLGFLRLDKNEDIIGFSQEFLTLLKNQLTADFLSAYPEVAPFYRKLAVWIGCAPENIYLSAGSDAGIKAVFEAFVEPQDTVLLLHPTYAMFYVYSEMFQARLVKMEYQKDLSLSAKELVGIIKREDPKLICIANPNSPTGTILAPEDIAAVLDCARERSCIVLLDEAYYPFYPVSALEQIPHYPNLLVSRTFSKAFGLAAARLGFVAGPTQTIDYLSRVRPMYEANAFALKFAELVIDNYHLVEQRLEEIARAKARLEQQLQELGTPSFKSFANFLLIDIGSPERALRLGQALYQRRILVKSGFRDIPLNNCIRVSIGSLEQMQYFVNNFKQVLEADKNA